MLDQMATQSPEPTPVPLIVPRMTPQELALFRRVLAGKDSYLEFGCGGSTLVALRSELKHLTSVDSDPTWIRRLRGHPDIASAERMRRLAFHHANIGEISDWGLPRDESHIRAWPSYYTDIWTRYAADYDVILIDGRFRVACALMSMILAPRRCAVLIHDYTIRPSYRVVEKYYETVEAVDTLVVLNKRREVDMKALTLDLLAVTLNVH